MDNFLLEGEQLLNQSSNNIVILTSYRVRYNADISSHAHIVSIMLEKVSSCEIKYQSSPWFLLFAGIAVVFGISTFTGFGNGPMGGVMLLVATVLVIAYFTSKKHVISISSDGGAKIGFETKGMKREAILSFINSIEKPRTREFSSYTK